MYKKLRNKELIIFDLDGVFYKDDNPIHGGKEIIDYLNQKNIDYCFFTNNSSFEKNRYVKKLFKCGIYINEDKIINPTEIINNYLTMKNVKNIHVLGSDALKKSLEKTFNFTDVTPEYIVIGMDNNISLKDISRIINICSKNTSIIAANPDKLIPTKKGFDLECGVIIDLIEEYSNKKVEVLGKPNKYGYEQILSKFNQVASKTLMVGDTYQTDILGAEQMEIDAVWIKTGMILPSIIINKSFIEFDNLIDLKNEIASQID